MYLMTKLWNPAVFQGHRRRRNYFEGWYFKQIDAEQKHRLAIIPGVSYGATPAGHHAFIQTFNGMTGETHYHRFPLEAFKASRDRFDLRIGANHFSTQGITLNIDDEFGQVLGSLRFAGGQPWPVKPLSPGIMGPYTFVPFMECNHGLLSWDHEITGDLTLYGEAVDFSRGRGYIEKDWGAAFPSAHIWMQTNHFETQGTSLSASVATIPWLGASFRGFIVGLWHHRRLYDFTTYSGGRITELLLTDDTVDWTLETGSDRDGYRLHIVAHRAEGGILAAPADGAGMTDRLMETLTAHVEVTLSRLEPGITEIIMQETGACAGLEVQGALDEILDEDHTS